jgi:hypothetical protein
MSIRGRGGLDLLDDLLGRGVLGGCEEGFFYDGRMHRRRLLSDVPLGCYLPLQLQRLGLQAAVSAQFALYVELHRGQMLAEMHQRRFLQEDLHRRRVQLTTGLKRSAASTRSHSRLASDAGADA